MTIPLPNIVNTQSTGGTSTGPFLTIFMSRAPVSTDIYGIGGQYLVGQRWISTVNYDEYVLINYTSSLGIVSANWQNTSNPSLGNVLFLAGNSGGNVPPTSGGLINVIGDGTTANVVGNPGTNTLTISAINGGGLSLGAFGSTPNADGLSLTSGVLNMQPADGTHPGGVSITTQTFGGAKNFALSASSPIFAVLSGGGGTAQIEYPSSATNYNFNLPSTAGSTGQLLTSGGGGSSPMTWTSPSSITISITGDTGGALVSNSFTFTASGIGLSFGGSGTTQTLSGTLTLAHGGTSASLTASNGGIFYSTASAGAILAGTATARQMLQSGATAAPAWSTTTWPATTTINTLLYSSAASVISALATANNSTLQTNGSGVPGWVTTSTGYVTSVVGTTNQLTPASATSGAVTVALTNGISLGSFSGSPPPTGGMLIPGSVAIGTTSPSSKGPLTVAGVIVATTNPTPPNDSTAAYFWNQSGVGPTISGASFQVQTGNTGSLASGFSVNSSQVCQFFVSTTGTGTALLGTNCPAVTVSAPYTWLQFLAPDGSTVYVPAYK